MPAKRLRLNDLEIDLDRCECSRAGQVIELERRLFDLLAYLAQRPTRVIGRAELLTEVWQARQLSPGVLATAVAKLRKAIGDDSLIETVRGRGYRLRAQSPAIAGASVVLESTPCSSGEPFVGRRAVLDVLLPVLSRAAERLQLVWISGEAGIGKSRLGRELADRARAAGASVWSGHAHAGVVAPAFFPWIEVVRATDAEPGSAALLTRLQAPEDGAGATRFQLYEELSCWIKRAARSGRRVIALEDLQWADTGTLAALAFLISALTDVPLLIVATWRDVPSVADAPRDEALRTIRRHALHVPLVGLEQHEVAELVDVLTGSAPGYAGLRQALAARTGGNPFFVRQLVALLQQQPEAPTPEMLARLPPPAAVQAVITARLGAFDADVRGLSAAAAALAWDLTFDARVLSLVLERPVSDVLAALEGPVRAGLLTRVGVNATGFGFGHALVQEVLYESLALAERGALHARIAAVLAGGSGPRFAEIAEHQLRAAPCDLTACLVACRRAADDARASAGFDVAARFAERALDKLAREGGDVVVRCEWLLALARDRHCGLDFNAARETLREGVMLTRGVAPSALFARFACELADLSITGGGPDAAEDVRGFLEEALERCGDDARQRALLLAHRAQTAFDAEPDARRLWMDEAERLATSCDEPALSIEVAVCRVSLRHPTRIAENVSAIARYRALVSRHPRLVSATQRSFWRFEADFAEYVCALTRAEPTELHVATQRCHDAVQRSQVLAHEVVRLSMAAGRALAGDQLAELRRSIEQLGRVAERLRGDASRLAQLVAAYFSLRIAEAEGGLDGVDLAAAAAVIALVPARHQRVVRTWMAWAAVKSGRLDNARGWLAEIAAQGGLSAPACHGDLGLLCMVAEVSHALGDDRASQQLMAALEPHAGLNAVGVCADYGGAVAHYLALLALQRGEHARAQLYARQALVIEARLDMPRQLTATRALLAAAMG
ncbi:MAG: AAA family ATPase [Polyangiales bacterium]